MKLVLVVLAALFLASCARVTIGRINADPSRFQNHTVRITGTVTNSVGLLGKGGYQLEDNTGRIYVISGKGVPSRGLTGDRHRTRRPAPRSGTARREYPRAEPQPQVVAIPACVALSAHQPMPE